jgi:hypothetical protein
MSSELLNGDKIMPDGSKRTYVNGLVTFIAYPAGTTRAQMILPKEINRIEGVQVNSIVLPPPTYTSSYNADGFQRAIDDGLRMASYQKASNDIQYAAGYNIDDYQKASNDIQYAAGYNIDDYQKAKVDDYGDNGFNANYNPMNLATNIPNSSINYILSPSEIASLERTQDINLPINIGTPTFIGTPSNLDEYQQAISDAIKTQDNTSNGYNNKAKYNNVYKNVPDFTSNNKPATSNNIPATFNNIPDTATFEEPSFISDNYILIIILSISILILLILFFVYKNKKSMNVKNIIASFGLI